METRAERRRHEKPLPPDVVPWYQNKPSTLSQMTHRQLEAMVTEWREKCESLETHMAVLLAELEAKGTVDERLKQIGLERG